MFLMRVSDSSRFNPRKECCANEAASLHIHYYTVELMLYEIALDNSIGQAIYGDYPMARLDLLFACFKSVKSFLDTFRDLPPSLYFDVPYALWTQVGRAIVILSRLSLCTAEGWDQSYVRSKLDFCDLVDTLLRDLQNAYSIALERSSDRPLPRVAPGIFSTLGPKMQQIKEAHEAERVAQIRNAEKLKVSSTSGGSLMLATPDSELDAMSTIGWFELFDDSFWQQLT